MKKHYTVSSNKKNSVRVLILLAILLSGINPVFSQAWQWAVTGGGSGTDGGRKTCVDASGNVFVVGYFASSSINLNGNNINNAGASGTDVFVAKYDAAGNYLWSQRIGGTGSEFTGGVCTDASGNVYVAVYFNSPNVTVTPYAAINTNTAGTTNDFLVAKFSSVGTISGIYKFGGPNNESINGIAYSNAQSAIYITGNYNSTSFAIGTTTLTNSSAGGTTYDVYVAKLSNTGVATWAKTTGSTNSNEYVSDVKIDANSYPHIYGFYAPVSSNTTVIGTTILTSYGGQDIYIAKYTDTGVFQWAKGIGTGSGQSDFTGGIAIDPTGNIYLAGYYYAGVITIGTYTLANNGQYDVFVTMCNSSGTFQWAKQFGSPLSDYANDLTIDGNNNIYLTGAFTGTTVAVGAYTLTNSAPGASDETYVIKYNSSGITQWATSAQGSGYEDGYGIASDPIGNVYVTGAYNIASPLVFGTTTLNSAGGNDMFLAKIGCASTSISSLPTLCTGSSATLVASGSTSYTWSTGANTASIVVTPTASSTYSLSGSTGSCNATGSTFSLTVLPASLYAGPNLNLTCHQQQVITATCNPAASSVSWAPATNLSSATVLNPTVVATGSSTQYTLTTTLNNGCVLNKTISVNSYAPVPDICMVTVDSLGQNNQVFWDKTSYPALDSMIILRETSTSVYKRIGAVSRYALSMFVDTVRSIGPSNGDPNVSTYRYKIQMRDTCGVYSTPSLWHNTIYFTNSNGTFFWVNNYTIEGTPLPTNPVLNYSLMVCINPSISPNYMVVGVTAGNQNSLTDPNYSTYQSTADWRVYGNLGYNCVPTLKANNPTNIMVNATKSRSNIQNNKTIGFKENILSASLKLYPNPAKDILNIDFESSNAGDYTVELQNVLGQVVYQSGNMKAHCIINTSSVAPGVYTVNIKQLDKLLAVKKIIVNK